MKRMGGWISLSKTANVTPPDHLLAAEDELQVLKDVLKSASLILDDRMEQAESELRKQNSPFHKLGLATALFLRATLGFEKTIMEEATIYLAEAEAIASEHQRRAIRDPTTAHRSKIYPAGAEYALCQAESQLMSAVVGVLNESLTESLKGFYKLRKAHASLQELYEVEMKYLANHSSRESSNAPVSEMAKLSVDDTVDNMGKRLQTPPGSQDNDIDDDSDLEFQDAEESGVGEGTQSSYQGHLELSPSSKSAARDSTQMQVSPSVSQSPETTTTDVEFTSITSDPIDIFTHSGISVCLGLFQLLLSLIPPAFSRILSIFSFRADRENGLRLLWKATAFKENANGGMAGLVLLGFHSAAIATCDIHTREALPRERIRALLHEMRALYPNSLMWVVEEARIASGERSLNRAIEVLQRPSLASPLKQIEALRVFESSIVLMCLHRYEECAASFLKCVDLNSWSHGMYYYNAGCAFVELYRVHRDSHPRKAAQYKEKA